MSESVSEDNGILYLQKNAKNILSIGVSTAGVAEIRMAKKAREATITATTIDMAGLADTQKYIYSTKYAKQIELKFEDVSQPLLYANNTFDFVYAMLVLHYLSKQQLATTLKEIHRVLRPKGRLYVVVKSRLCPEALAADAVTNAKTGLTSFTYANSSSVTKRYFHTSESIKNYIKEAGFKVNIVQGYYERLYSDFMRTKLAKKEDHIIEVRAVK